MKDFENFEDISDWLKDQWAGLFAEYLSKRKSEIEMKALASQVAELESITNTLKEYIEAIMKKIEPPDYKEIITEQKIKMDRRKAERFCSEDLINYIRYKYVPEKSELDIFNAFENSGSLPILG